MPAKTGQSHQVFIGRHDTNPKAVPAPAQGVWYKRMTANMPPKVDKEIDESSIGDNFKNQDSEILATHSEPNFGGKVRSHSIGYPLLGVTNHVPVTTAHAVVSAVKSHVFVPSNLEVINGLGVVNYNPNYTAPYEAYTNFKVSELMIDIDQTKAWVEFNCSGMANGRAPATGHTARTYPTEQLFRRTDIEFKMANTVADLASASAINFRKLSLKLTRELEKDDTVTGLDPDEIYSTQYGYMIDIEEPFRDDVFRNLWLSDAEQVCQLEIKNPIINIGNPSNIIRPSLTFLFNRGHIMPYDHSTDIGNTVMTESWSFEGLKHATPYTATLVNTRASY